MPANATPTNISGRVAAAAIGQFMPIRADGQPAGAGDAIIGFTQATATAGSRVPVAVDGSSIAWAGEAIADGDLLQVGPGGTVVKRAAGAVIGRALNAGAAGDKIECLIFSDGGAASLSDGPVILFNGQEGVTAYAAQFNDDLLDQIISENFGVAITIKFERPYHFRRSHTARSAVILECAGKAAAIKWIPSTPGDYFFIWSRNSSSPAQQSEDGQLVGCGVRSFYIESDRTVRAKGLWFNGVDFPIIQGEAWGIKGTSLRMSNTREGSQIDWRDRFCGYCDVANAANNEPSVLMDVNSASWDSTNLNSGGTMMVYYPFGPGLVLDGAYSNFFSVCSVHGLGRADAALEPGFVTAFPTFNGQPAALGWDGSGNPRNEYASLHVGAPSVADVTGRVWQDSVAQSYEIHLKKHSSGQAAVRNRFGIGRVIGGGRLYSVLVEDSSSAAFASMEIVSAQPWAANVTIDTGTDVATVTSTTAASCCVGAPPTGTPVLVTGTPPAPLAASQVYYLIRTSATTVKFAKTYALAIAGTAIDLTSAGASVVLFAGGIPLCALNNAEIKINDQSLINEGSIAAWSDPTSVIHGMATVGSTFNNGPIARHVSPERLLFVARDVYVDATGDVARLKKVFGGRRYIATRRVAIQRSSVSAAGATLGVFTAAAGGGTALVTAQALSGLGTANNGHNLTVYGNTNNEISGLTISAAYSQAEIQALRTACEELADDFRAVGNGVPFGADGTDPYINVSVAGAAGAVVDVFIYGYPAD